MNPKSEYTYKFDFYKPNDNYIQGKVELVDNTLNEAVASDTVNLDFDDNGKVISSRLDIMNQLPTVYKAEKIINNAGIESMKPVDSFEPFLDVFEEIPRFKEEAQNYYNENDAVKLENEITASKLGIEFVSSSFESVDVGEDGDFALVYKPVVNIEGRDIELWLDVDTSIVHGTAISATLGEGVEVDGSHEIIELSNSDDAITVADNVDITQSAMNEISHLSGKYGETNERETDLFDKYYEAVEEVVQKDLNNQNLEFIKNSKLDEYGISHSRLEKTKDGYESSFQSDEPKKKKSKSLGMSM